MLEIKNLTKRYRNASVNAVEDLNLKLNEGEIFGFLGMNGAGKSTTIKCLTGIYPFDKGQITICGQGYSQRQYTSQAQYRICSRQPFGL